MDKKVVVINGSGGVGKDTFVTLVGNYARVVNVSSIDPYKELLYKTGWNGEKSEESRKALSELKQISIMFNNGPTNYVENKYNEFLLSDNDIMFVHIREPEEIKRFQKKIDCNKILVRRSSITDGKIYGNSADDDVEKFDYDYIIDNNSDLDCLEKKIKTFFDNQKIREEIK